MNNLIDRLANWPFLNEPFWRWAVFFVAFSGFLVAWNGVLAFMK